MHLIKYPPPTNQPMKWIYTIISHICFQIYYAGCNKHKTQWHVQLIKDCVLSYIQNKVGEQFVYKTNIQHALLTTVQKIYNIKYTSTQTKFSSVKKKLNHAAHGWIVLAGQRIFWQTCKKHSHVEKKKSYELLPSNIQKLGTTINARPSTSNPFSSSDNLTVSGCSIHSESMLCWHWCWLG